MIEMTFRHSDVAFRIQMADPLQVLPMLRSVTKSVDEFIGEARAIEKIGITGPIEWSALSVTSRKALRHQQIDTNEKLAAVRVSPAAEWPYVGPVAENEMIRYLKSKGWVPQFGADN